MKKEPEVLEKLEKFFVEVLEAEEIADKAAGGDGAVLNRAGGARKIREAEEIADNFTEGDEFPEERAGGARETEERAGGARETGEIFRQSTGSRRNC